MFGYDYLAVLAFQSYLNEKREQSQKTDKK